MRRVLYAGVVAVGVLFLVKEEGPPDGAEEEDGKVCAEKGGFFEDADFGVRVLENDSFVEKSVLNGRDSLREFPHFFVVFESICLLEC